MNILISPDHYHSLLQKTQPLSEEAIQARSKIVIPRLVINTKTNLAQHHEKEQYLLTPVSPPLAAGNRSSLSSFVSIGSTVSSHFSFNDEAFNDLQGAGTITSQFISAGNALFTMLFPDKISVEIKAFCKALISKFTPGKNVDLPSLVLMIQPVNNLVSAEILDRHLFRLDNNLHSHIFAQPMTVVYGFDNGTLSQGTLDFIHEMLYEFKAENGEDFLRLGLLYYDGKRIKRDYEIALGWFNRAQKAGNMEAAVYVGVCRLQGKGVARNEATAFASFQCAAKAKDFLGMLYLSRCYQYGIGTDIDQTKAMKWHDRAAVCNSVAQFEKGMQYYDGIEGKEKDESKALEWFLTAANQGHLRAIFFAGCIYRDRKDFANAKKWFKIGADRGDLAAINNSGFIYQHASGVEESFEDAAFWYQKGVERNYPPAIHNLATMYQLGTGVEQSDMRAINLFSKAASMGYAPSQHHLARCYQAGVCVDRDISQALYWYEKSIDYPQSQNSLGFLYEKGFGVERDDTKAEKYYLMAAEQGDICAQYNLGDFYEKRGNISQAKGYFTMAAAQGDSLSSARLSLFL